MHQHQGYFAHVQLLRPSPTVVLVVCVCCRRTVTACSTRDDAIWAAAVHAVRGVG
jgi:hypothetical protein